MRHTFSIRKEKRQSYYGNHPADWRAEDAYPCPEDCKQGHRHSGIITNLYAHCSCGWDEFVGQNIYGDQAALEGRLRHLQHQINDLQATRVVSSKEAKEPATK